MAARLNAAGKYAMFVIAAAMRKLVYLCFGVLKNRVPYRADFLKNA
ncbi:MAG: hypothetical protein LBG78_08435 [Azoarcus sp.]|jgi:hypothetical protein|nr:hypothetical protein [Azoarcus sp.]